MNASTKQNEIILNEDHLEKRIYMLKYLIRLSDLYSLSDESFFFCLNLIDTLLKKHKNLQVNLITIACLLITSKLIINFKIK